MIPPGKTHSVRLCATFIGTVKVPGRYGDGYGGHGLSLLVTPRKSGGLSKTWAQAVSPNGTNTSLGLGSYPVVTLAMARERALAIRMALGGDGYWKGAELRRVLWAESVRRGGRGRVGVARPMVIGFEQPAVGRFGLTQRRSRN